MTVPRQPEAAPAMTPAHIETLRAYGETLRGSPKWAQQEGQRIREAADFIERSLAAPASSDCVFRNCPHTKGPWVLFKDFSICEPHHAEIAAEMVPKPGSAP